MIEKGGIQNMTSNVDGKELSREDQAVVDNFFKANQLFYSPDPEVMRYHGLQPRSKEEERILEAGFDAQ